MRKKVPYHPSLGSFNPAVHLVPPPMIGEEDEETEIVVIPPPLPELFAVGTLQPPTGPNGPEETNMPAPSKPETTPSRASRATAWSAGVGVAIAVVALIAFQKAPRALGETPADKASHADEAAPGSAPPLPAPQPIVEAPPAPPRPEPAVVEEPAPEPVVAAVEEPARPEPAAPPPTPARTPPASPPPATKALPASLVVSAMGNKPRCAAACVWGNLSPEGLPKIVDDARTVICGEDTWIVAARTEIKDGAQKSCFTVTGISEPPPSGP